MTSLPAPKPSPDFVRTLGPLGLSLRLKRLSERLTEGGRRLYERLEVPLEPSWFALLLLLEERGELAVTAAAEQLGLSHPSVIETTRKLTQQGWVETARDPGDGRRRLLRLSAKARAHMPEFRELWAAFRTELEGLCEPATGDLLAGLARLEGELEREPLDERVRRRVDLAPSTPARASERARPRIRPTRASDRAAVLHIARELVRSGDTYAYDPHTSDDALWAYWAPEEPGQGFAAWLEDELVGVFVLRPNHPGPGAHVANASYAVRADQRGRGLGRAMGEASLLRAHELGYRAMQFNIVVETNRPALRLWRSLGFAVVGTIPEGFRHADGSYSAHYVMHRKLEGVGDDG